MVGYRRRKYGNKKVSQEFLGEMATFDSKAEAYRASELELLQKGGVIKELRRQVRFKLGEKKRCDYIADFVYSEGGRYVIEDVKGFETKEWKVKWAWMHDRYPGAELRVWKKGKGYVS